MSDSTSIEWTDATWNPTRGCSRVSPGCVHCYAERQAIRHAGPVNKGGLINYAGPYSGLVRSTSEGPRWTGEVRLVEDALTIPLRWREPRRIFVDSMSDLFHEALPDSAIDVVFSVMAAAVSGGTRCRRPQHDHDDGECSGWPFARHTFQVLTKRPDRMRAYLSAAHREDRIVEAIHEVGWSFSDEFLSAVPWPLPNVWLGVSVEDQQRADERIPLLLQTPAAVRFLSVEPLLGPVDLRPYFGAPDQGRPHHACGTEGCQACGNIGYEWSAVGWVIVGGESGPGARPCDVAWIRSVVQQCRAASVPVFVKQVGSNVRDRNDAGFDVMDEVWAEGPGAGRPTNPTGWPVSFMDVEENPDGVREEYQGAQVRVGLRDRKGGDPAEWPEDLRVREFPR